MPNKTRWATTNGKVDEFNDGSVLHVGNHTAALAANGALRQFNVHPKRSVRNVLNIENRDSGKTDKRQTAGANRLWVHGGSPLCWR